MIAPVPVKNPADDAVDEHADHDDSDNEGSDSNETGAPGAGEYTTVALVHTKVGLTYAWSIIASKKKKKKKPKKKKVTQSEPPRVGLSKLFPSGVYPEGEIQEYKDEYVLPSTTSDSTSFFPLRHPNHSRV